VQATRAVWLNLQQVNKPVPKMERSQSSLSPLLSQILHNRGIQPEDQATYLHPEMHDLASPMNLTGMREAVARLQSARKNAELVAVLGDSDVDGITATAVLVQAFTAAGLRVIPCIPSRLEGAGLSQRSLKDLQMQGAQVIVTVDCGMASTAEIAEAVADGLDVIVTDHHKPLLELPPALAIVNPHLEDVCSPCKDLAGVGVAFRLAQALLRATRRDAIQREYELLDLVLIGTIGDMAPLVGENRILASHGLRVLNETRRVGLQALVSSSGLSLGSISATDVGIRLCPRLNVAGRNGNAALGYDLLVSTSAEAARTVVQKLEEMTVERQHRTQQALIMLHEQLGAQPSAPENHLLVLRVDAWAADIMGLLAGKIVEEFAKPVVVLLEANGEVRGSARGVPGFDILEALQAHADLLRRFGGHQLAAGFTADSQHAEALVTALRQRVATLLSAKEALPTLQFDAELSPGQITWRLLDQLQALEPCGIGNPSPLFLCRRLRVLEFRIGGNNHLRLSVGKGGQRLEAFVFRRGDLARFMHRHMDVDLIFSLETNEWNDVSNLQLRVRDMAFEPNYSLGLDSGAPYP